MEGAIENQPFFTIANICMLRITLFIGRLVPGATVVFLLRYYFANGCLYIITTLPIGHVICILTKKNLIGQSDTQCNTTHYLFIL